MIKLENGAIIIVKSSTLEKALKANEIHLSGMEQCLKDGIQIGQNAIVIEYPDNLFHSNNPSAFDEFIIRVAKGLRVMR